MTREELDFIGAMNMCDEISNAAYKKIVCHCEEQEPCDDAISRDAVIDAIEHEDKWLLAAKGHNGLTEIAFSGLKARVDALPPVTQKSAKDYLDMAERKAKKIKDALTVTQKPGKWRRVSIDKYSEHAKYWYRCDRCGKDNLGNTDWCPNCGAKMEVENG